MGAVVHQYQVNTRLKQASDRINCTALKLKLTYLSPVTDLAPATDFSPVTDLSPVIDLSLVISLAFSLFYLTLVIIRKASSQHLALSQGPTLKSRKGPGYTCKYSHMCCVFRSRRIMFIHFRLLNS